MSAVATSGRVHVSSHPVMKHKLTILRNEKTSARSFRQNLKDLTFYLGYEATSTLNTVESVVKTPLADYHGQKLSDEIALVPIMRSGLGMVDPMLELLPDAAVHHIGMYRNKHSLVPIQYYNKLPQEHDCAIAYVLEPLIATSGTISAVIGILKRWGARKVVVLSMIASQKGLARLVELHPDVDVYVGAIDETLSASGLIVPGLGDCGDRLFTTPDPEPLSATAEPHRLNQSAVAISDQGRGSPRRRAGAGAKRTASTSPTGRAGSNV